MSNNPTQICVGLSGSFSMNGIDKIDNNSKFSNRPTATAENIEPKSNHSTSLPASSKSELHLQNSTVMISEEAKLLSKSTEF